MQEKNSTQDLFSSPTVASLPYLGKRRAEAGGIITLCLCWSRERAVLKADQSNSSYLLSEPSYPTLALLEEVTELCGLLLGSAQKSFTTV